MILPRSIFFKLLAVYAVTFCLIAAVPWGFLSGRSFQRLEPLRANVRHFVELLTAEIGVPPDLGKAKKLHDALDLGIIVRGPGVEWSTNPEMSFERKGIIRVERGDFLYGFSVSQSIQPFNILALRLAVLFFGIVLTLSFYIVRLLLRPIKQMREAAHRFGELDWKKRMPVRGGDELAELGRTLNDMADRIEGYVGSMHRLLAAVSHELRSPLTRMKVALEFVHEEKIRASLNEEIDLLDRMTGLLLERERLRARPDVLTRELTEVRPWLEEVVRPYMRSGTPVSLEGPDLSVLLDRARMTMAIGSLVDNCARHAAGSPVLLRWDGPLANGSSLRLAVEDSGPGISKQLLGRLGEPFLLIDDSRSRKGSNGGFGLGLSLVFAIVEAHGGKVRATNALPRGLKIEIEI